MNEFRKPYEYEEEKGIGGFLMVFFVMLLSVEVLLALMILVQGYAVLKAVQYLGPAFGVLGIGYLIFLLFTCIALKRRSRYAVTISKILLMVRVIFVTPVYILLFATFSRNPGIVSGFRSRSDIVRIGLIVPLAYILSFSGLWYWYFSSSKRVKQFVQTASAQRGDRADASST
jgi:hypothetical protein